MQRKLLIREEEMTAIRQRKREEPNAKIFKRLLALEMRGCGAKCQDIAALLGVCLDTVSDWTNLFLAGGVEALCSLEYEGRRPSMLEPYTEEMKEKVEKESVSSLLQMQTWLKEEHNVEVEQSWLFRFCKKNSIFPTRKQG